MGRPPTSLAAQHLDHYAANDLLVEGLIKVHKGLLDEALSNKILPTDLLGCRWRVPLSWAHNLSRVLTFYRDQLNTQTHDQVHIGCNVLLLTI